MLVKTNIQFWEKHRMTFSK